MRRRPVADFAVGMVLKVALDRLTRHEAPAPRPVPGRTTQPPDRSPESDTSPPRALLAFTFASLAVALVLMLVFHAPVTRVFGVAAIFAFIVSGAFLIADHTFLGPEQDHESLRDRPRG